MSHRQKLSPSLLAGLGVAVLPAVARAQTIPPACRPLIEAEKKVEYANVRVPEGVR